MRASYSTLLARTLRKRYDRVEVQIAVSFADATAKVQEAELAGDPFDVVFLDLIMPPFDAHQTLEQMAGVVETWPPIIVVTGMADADVHDKALLFGADNYITKDRVLDDAETLCRAAHHATLRRTRARNYAATRTPRTLRTP